MKKFNWEDKYIQWGIVAFLVIACAIVFFMLIRYVGSIFVLLGHLVSILSPFIWGAVIAYLLLPILKFAEDSVTTPVYKKIKLKLKNTSELSGKDPGRIRAIAVFLSELFMIVIVVGLITLILPQMYNSIETFFINSPVYMTKVVKWAENLLNNYPQVEHYVINTFGNINDALSSWVSESLLPSVNNIITNLTTSIIVVFKGIYNVVIGIIVSVYLLHNKEHVKGILKKLLYSLFSVPNANRLHEGFHFVDRVLMGFVSGKIIDSAIIGVICYIFSIITNMPYALLISVIVGVTNIIPFFGPFIGAIPSVIIILFVSPAKCLVFLIFIILLQQFDGNILGPKILGNSVGIGGFWVMFSIIVGAGLFGFWGMLLGVPVWVIIYTGIQIILEKRLEKKGLKKETDEYIKLEYVDIHTHEMKEYSVNIEENKKGDS